MHLYWRINQDLECLGEYLVFNDPRFVRCFKAWIFKNRDSLFLMHAEELAKGALPSVN